MWFLWGWKRTNDHEQLLDDGKFWNKIHQLIDESMSFPLYQNKKLIWWDDTKYQIKQFPKLYPQKSKRKRKIIFSQYRVILGGNMRRICDRDIDQKRILELQLKLKEYESEKCSDAIFRSKATWASKSDNNISYLKRLEKNRQDTNTVKRFS